MTSKISLVICLALCVANVQGLTCYDGYRTQFEGGHWTISKECDETETSCYFTSSPPVS